MKEKCIICNKELFQKDIYLCKKHTACLSVILDNGKYNGKQYKRIEKTEFKHHCEICGEYKNRVIVNYPDPFFICSMCIKSAKKKYNL